jgi:cytochrome c-type biogenesis protein CcmH/NrfG
MKTRALVLAVLCGSLNCSPLHSIAKADRPPAAWGKPLPPIKTPSARAWQASYAAEADGKFEDALNALTELGFPQRDSYLASYRRGWLLYRLGHYAESAAAYDKATAIAPNSIEARVAMLVPLMALSKWDDVAAVAAQVLKFDPQNYLAMQRLAFAKFSTQHFPEAEQIYRRLVELYPSDIELRSCLAWATLRMGKLKEAAALFSQVLDVKADHVSAGAGLKEATAHKQAKP